MAVPGTGNPPQPQRPLRLLTEAQLSGLTPRAPGMRAPPAAGARVALGGEELALKAVWCMVVQGPGIPPKPQRPLRLLTEVQLSGLTPGAPGMMAPTAAAASAGRPTTVVTGFSGTVPPG